MIKVMVLGLDGATWSLLLPLIRRGKLPTLRKLLEKSAWGPLESSKPPVTFPAWKCYSTGKNPGKLGVYWWLNVDFDRKRFVVNNSLSFRGWEIWDYLSVAGYSCGIIGMPTTHPPKPVNGFMVSEGGPEESAYTYPPELKNMLKELFDYSLGEFVKCRSPECMIRECWRHVKQRFNAAIYLAERFRPEFLNLTILQTDTIQHLFWSDEGGRGFGVLEKFWKLVDHEIGRLISRLVTEKTFLFLISDHGFTKLHCTINLSEVLCRLGYLKPSLRGKIIRGGRRLFEKMLGKNMDHYIKGVLEFLRLRGLRPWKYQEMLMDWNSSLAIPLPSGLIYVNKRIVGEEETKIASNILEDLRVLLELEPPVFEEVLLGEEVYVGDNNSPNIYVTPHEKIYLTSRIDEYRLVIREQGLGEHGVCKWRGKHHPQGIFLASGPGVRRGFFENIRIYDIAPTILHVFNLPIPRDMDGRVLTEILAELPEPKYVDPSYYKLIGLKMKIAKLREALRDRSRRLNT